MSDQEETTGTAARKEAEAVGKWLNEISLAQKREEKFRKQGKSANSIYEAEKTEVTPYNVLYSNTETILPALYNSTPRPTVDRRFKDEDPVGMLAAKVAQRALEFQLDSGSGDEDSFDMLVETCVLEALVPGRGLIWFKYDAKIEPIPGAEPGEDGNPLQQVTYECVTGENVGWNRLLHGYAKVWSRVPWVAVQDFMDRTELEENFGKEVAEKVELTRQENGKGGGENGKGNGVEGADGVDLAEVFSIWDKTTRKVYFVSPGYPDAFLKQTDDPLGLEGFFPCPEPLKFFRRTSSLIPVPLYEFYRNQAEELNIITGRITKLVAALRLRGFYDSTVEGLDKVITAEDNALVPLENTGAYIGQGQPLERAIWLFPIEKLTGVLQQLYVQREAIKKVIFEITGIADIMRGSTQASETLGAQEIKQQWGTLRLKRSQRMVQRYVRDCLRIQAEIIFNKFSPQTLMRMTGISLPQQADKEQAQMVAQQLAQAGQEPPMRVVETLSVPSWEDVLSLLRNDLQRRYRIDIETNSTVDAEATEDKKDIAEMMGAMAQLFNGFGPLVEKGLMPFEIAKEILLVVSRRFRFGKEVEEKIKQIQGPQPVDQDGKAEKELEMKLHQQETQQKMELNEQTHKFKLEELAAQQEHRRAELELEKQALAMKRQDLMLRAMMPTQGQPGQGQRKPGRNTNP